MGAIFRIKEESFIIALKRAESRTCPCGGCCEKAGNEQNISQRNIAILIIVFQG
jgi:hypothetical protein